LLVLLDTRIPLSIEKSKNQEKVDATLDVKCERIIGYSIFEEVCSESISALYIRKIVSKYCKPSHKKKVVQALKVS
jgi:hypothetical protein